MMCFATHTQTPETIHTHIHTRTRPHTHNTHTRAHTHPLASPQCVVKQRGVRHCCLRGHHCDCQYHDTPRQRESAQIMHAAAGPHTHPHTHQLTQPKQRRPKSPIPHSPLAPVPLELGEKEDSHVARKRKHKKDPSLLLYGGPDLAQTGGHKHVEIFFGYLSGMCLPSYGCTWVSLVN